MDCLNKNKKSLKKNPNNYLVLKKKIRNKSKIKLQNIFLLYQFHLI